MSTRRVRVGDILKLERLPLTVDDFTTYTAIGVRSFGKGIFHYPPTPGAELSKLRFFEVKPGRLVISNIKGWEGAIALSGEADAGCVASNRFLTYIADPRHVDASYLRHFFLSDAGLPLIQRASPGSADRNRTLAIDRFEALEIPIPEISRQQEIAARLDGITSTIAQVYQLANQWDRLQLALIPALAQRNDINADAKRCASWTMARLRDVLVPVSDLHQVQRDVEYANAGILSFGRGLFDKAPIEGSRTSARTLNRIRSGQFIYSRLFAFEGAYAEVPARFDGYFLSNEFPSFDVDTSRTSARFIAAYLRSPAKWQELASTSKGLGNRRQRIQPNRLLDFSFWLPPLAVQRRAIRAMDIVDQCCEKREGAIEVIGALQKAVLNRAFADLL